MPILVFIPKAFDINENDSKTQGHHERRLSVVTKVSMKEGVVFYQNDCHFLKYDLVSKQVPGPSCLNPLVRWTKYLQYTYVSLLD